MCDERRLERDDGALLGERGLDLVADADQVLHGGRLDRAFLHECEDAAVWILEEGHPQLVVIVPMHDVRFVAEGDARSRRASACVASIVRTEK